MTNDVCRKLQNNLKSNEWVAVIILILTIAFLTLFDVVSDWQEGAHFSHIIPELLIVILALIASFYMYRKTVASRLKIIEEARAEIDRVKADSDSWKAKAEQLSSGVTDAISEQLGKWRLTKAEQDVCFLLLKGLTTQEIAAYRNTSERTSRQQASEIYKKSGLSGRSQLSAFFLEDLFVIED